MVCLSGNGSGKVWDGSARGLRGRLGRVWEGSGRGLEGVCEGSGRESCLGGVCEGSGRGLRGRVVWEGSIRGLGGWLAGWLNLLNNYWNV